jgi:hypothetical protein
MFSCATWNVSLNYRHLGPDHLIIRDPKAIPVVLGPKDMWPKHGRESCTLACFCGTPLTPS